jgi:exonuclease III
VSNSKRRKTNTSNLSVTLLNARSLKSVKRSCNKLVQLSNLAGVTDSDLIAITETWLNNDVSDNELLNSNYTIYRRDRSVSSSKRGGGILLAIKKDLNSSLIISHSVSEIMAIYVQNIVFILCYRPPRSGIDEFVSNLNVIITSVQKSYEKVCILGDFNFPDLKWNETDYDKVFFNVNSNFLKLYG